ncbi:MAG: hypothetical protein AAF497_21830, partial [Planctomycetota bacterium]
AIRRFETMSKRFFVFILVGHLLFAVGVSMNLVNPTFAFFAWMILANTFVLLIGQNYTRRCPRCSYPFHYKTMLFGFRFPANVADSCAHCGLRALSQADIRGCQPNDLLAIAETDTNAPLGGSKSV